ncbi:glyoxylate reductase/hydroxypyruvate reductase-like [Condylostylus longicornis]|uniref:glyoxylate reductase/hydroxypyruvate reductase-like n=1 Tax=Condylostylus longicornis TaxID=2530218 RepID=UPI00244DA17B|nr:glyoxylate reductase/hydroxypyruvate reductase-like [Condylostylus longicornis]
MFANLTSQIYRQAVKAKVFKKSSRLMMSETNNLPKVLVTRPDVASIGIELLKKEFDVTTWSLPSPMPREEFLKSVVGKNGIFCTLTDKIDAELLDMAGPELKVVATISVGYDHIDISECKKRNIRIGYTPDVLTDATAELTMALLLATNRRLFEANKEVFNGGWSSWSPSWMCGPGLKGSVIGIFGYGRIGQEVAKRCVPFKPKKIVYFNRSEKPKEASEVGASFVNFNDLLKTSDVIIVCCALTPETKEIFNYEAFQRMKPNCIFINTSRGGLVDQKSLYQALKEKRIWGAGLDVTTPEPLPLDDPLLTLKNCLILPHIGSADINTRIEMSKITATNIIKALKNQEMISEIK